MGTTTPALGNLTLGHGSEPQLMLTDNVAGDKLWAFRTIGDKLYIATSTASATGTPALLTMDGTKALGVGIGTNTPQSRFVVHGADNTTVAELHIPVAQASVTTADTFLSFTSATGVEGSVAGTAVAGVIAFNTFTAQHWTHVIGQTPKILDVLRIYEGGEEPLKGKGQLFNTEVACKAKDKAIVGVYAGQNPEGLDGVLALGTGYAKVYNAGRNIEVGDLLTSSNECGLAMLQTNNIFQLLLTWRIRDDTIRSYTLAQATESVVWKLGETERKISVLLKK